MQKVILASGREGAEFVQLGVHPLADNRPLANLDGGFRVHGALNLAEEFFAVAKASHQFFQGFAAGEAGFDGPGKGESPAQLHHFAGIGFAGGNAAQDAFHIPQLAQVHLRFLQDFRVPGEVFYYVVTGIELLQVHDGHGQPLPQHARTHGAGAFVQGLHQGYAIGPGSALEHLQVAERELVHPHKLGLVNAADGADISETHVLGLFQIYQQSPGAADAQGIRVYGKALEAIYPQLALEALYRGVVHKGPFVYGRGENVSQTLPEAFFIASLDHQLPGLEGAHQGGNVIQRALRHLELARGNVQEGGAAQVFFHREAAEVVVLLGVQHVLPEGDAGRNNLRYAALDQLLGKLGVFQLVADCPRWISWSGPGPAPARP